MSGVERSSQPSASKNFAASSDCSAHVVVVALSAGGLPPLRAMLRQLPPDFPAAIIVCQHMRAVTQLPAILLTATRLHATLAETGDTLRPGTIYVGPPGRHTIIAADGRIQIADRPRIRHRHSPSADWLFESVSGTFGDRAIAVVLSGCMSDGARGALRIREAGGYVIVQDPSTCWFPDMPIATIRLGGADAILAPEQMPATLMNRLNAVDHDAHSRAWAEPFAV